jgi:hypothetical protein
LELGTRELPSGNYELGTTNWEVVDPLASSPMNVTIEYCTL